MTYKKYHEVDAEWGRAGEVVIREFFTGQGYQVTALPNGIYEQDLMFKTRHECFYVEVERCGADRWPADSAFRYSTINILARREITPDRLFFTVRSDLRQAYVVFPNDLQSLDVIRRSNKHVKNERVREYPIERALLLDFDKSIEHSIAAMNAERVRNIVNDGNASYKFKMSVLRGKNGELGSPYGLFFDEWTTAIRFVEKSHGLTSQVAKPQDERQGFMDFQE